MLFIRSGQNPVSLCAKAEVNSTVWKLPCLSTIKKAKYTEFSHCTGSMQSKSINNKPELYYTDSRVQVLITFKDLSAILLISTKEQCVHLTNKLDLKHHCTKLV